VKRAYRTSGFDDKADRQMSDYRRMAKGKEAVAPSERVPHSPTLCKLCGTHISGHQKFCSACAPTNSKEALIEAARKGRIAAESPQVLARLAEKQRSHRLAERSWKPADKPDWLDDRGLRPANSSPARSAAIGVDAPLVVRACRLL
jgi:hypothetical protein